MQQPENLEGPFAELVDHPITPVEKFYVRSHFAVPKIDPAKHTITVTGHVASPFEVSMEDLAKLPQVKRQATLECAGNGRVFLTPAVTGLQWGHGGVSTAEWAGVPLGAILERANDKRGAVDVVLTGADKGPLQAPVPSPGAIHFDRGIPIEKVKREECLLATKMNGQPLTPSHGAPVRAIIGGWYGMASVKWVTKIVVTDRPWTGFWQTFDYSLWERRDGGPAMVPLTAMQPKAIILTPGLNSAVAAGSTITVTGKAWAGERKVAKVEFSADGGTTWHAARLTSEEVSCCWRDWRYDWTVPRAVRSASLVARCTDDAGNAQPATRDADRRSYMINHLIPMDVVVR
jgi:DMSO/TMAO reductase YedYZ molybdopterin-dependent catalytic subunit